MNNMKKKYFWADSETTGQSVPAGHQILSIAIVVKDYLGQIRDTLDIKIKLKPNAVVEPKALEVNKIDPYSKEFNEGAYTYSEAKILIKEFILKNQAEDYDHESIALAYNARFDFKFLDAMFSESNDFFRQLFHMVVDPLILAKKLTRSGKVKTEPKSNDDGTTYFPSSLQAMAKFYNTKDDGDAHTAIADVRTMILTTEAMWKTEYNESMYSDTSNKILDYDAKLTELR